MNHAILHRSYVDCSCGSPVDFVYRVVRRDPEDVMQRKRYVATQKESRTRPRRLAVQCVSFINVFFAFQFRTSIVFLRSGSYARRI